MNWIKLSEEEPELGSLLLIFNYKNVAIAIRREDGEGRYWQHHGQGWPHAMYPNEEGIANNPPITHWCEIITPNLPTEQ